MKKISRFLIILSVFISVMSSTALGYALGVKDETTDLLTVDKEKQIEKFIQEGMDKGKIPGLSITIVKDDKTIYQKGFGYSDLESKDIVTEKSLFEIGSNSKAFTALGILKLEEQGKIKLGDDVSKYIPWFRLKYKGNDVNITISQLMYHTSGIPFNTIDKIQPSNEESALEDVVKMLINTELESQPGERFEYATINYDVLGLVIEKISGLSYESYMEENILKPMDLNNTFLYRDNVNSKHMTKGYKLELLKPCIYEAPVYRGNKPAGYIMSSGEDMAKWLKIQLGSYNNLKLSENLIEKSHKPNRSVAPYEDGSSYAGGWFVYQKGGGIIRHEGSNPNYSSVIMFRPEDKVGVAVLSNINSECVASIANGVNRILQGMDYNKNFKDLNKSADKVSILIIGVTILVIITALYFIVKTFKEIFKKERVRNKNNIKNIFKIGFSLVFMIGLSYSIYLIPYILYMGVSWKFVFVWLPNTIKLAIYLLYASVWLVYIYALLTSFYKKKQDKSILILSILSFVSGVGNALIIFTINLAINSNNSTKIKLLVYFTLGIITYVYGQKIMREKLIEITNGIVYSKRMEIIKCVLRSPYQKFEGLEKGRIESTLNNDTETISRFANILISGITSAITLICCFIYLGAINLYALLLSVIIILLIASIYYLVGRYANKIGEQTRDLQNVFFKFINDLTGGFKELSINGKKKREFEVDIEKSCDKYRVKRGQSALAFANMFIIGELLFTLAIGGVAFIFPLILNNLENTSVSSYVFILLYMVGPVHGILDTIPNAVEVKISLKRINDLLNDLSISSNKDSNTDKLNIEDKVTLKLDQVHYIYDDNDENSFKVGPISYEFNSGEIIFITGGNGSGKSTLAKLITGLYPPSKGNITLNNSNISQKELNEHYSTVFGDFYLFDKLYGIDYLNKERQIKKYLSLLQLDKKVTIKDGRFSTTKLSTGQKKRLALLVTYLEDRPIYLFDEWAADQDPEFRMFFYDTLLPDLKQRGKCIIAITHDDRYFDMADKLIKMELGKFA